MRIFIASILLLSNPVVLASPTWGQDFCSGDGVVLGDTGTENALAITLDAGSLFVAGDDQVGNGEWRIEKRNPADGALVSGFGNAGIVTSNPSFNWDRPTAVAMDAGSVYVAGFDSIGGTVFYRWRIEKRSRADGALVAGFGSGGVVTGSTDAGTEQATAIIVDASFMYVAGAGVGGWKVEKRNVVDGALVAGFGTGGTVTSAGTEAYAIATDGSALYVVGSDYVSWRIEKRDGATGALLYTVTEPFPYVGCGGQGAYAIAIDGDSMFVAGTETGEWRVERRTLATGALVYAQTITDTGDCDEAHGIAIDAGAMYVVGELGNQWRVEKRNLSTGALVGTFGSAGAVTVDDFAFANAVAIDADVMYIAGSGNREWRIEKRKLSTGALVKCPRGTATPTPTPVPGTPTTPSACAPMTLSDCSVRVLAHAATQSQDRLKVRCLMTLGAASNGIDPAREAVRLMLTDAAPSIAPCFDDTVLPLRVGRCWRYVQADSSSRLWKLRLCDVDPAAGVYRLTARARRSDLSCLNAPPHGVELEIGDDCTEPCSLPGGCPSGATPTPTTIPTPNGSPGGCRTVSAYPSLVVNAPGARQWQNPGAALVGDSVRATIANLAPGQVSDFLVVNNFGFALPSYTKVTGIMVEVKRASTSGTGIQDASVELRKGLSHRGEKTAAGYWSAVEGYVAYGGISDTWDGSSWTPDEVNSPDFGVALAIRNSSSATDSAQVDHVRVTVFYVTASSVVGPRSPTVASDDAAIGTRAWTNPANVLTADGAAAEVIAMIHPEVTHYLRVSGFGFTGLPSTSPSGILLEVQRAASFGSFTIADNAVRLVKNGQIGVTDRSAGFWDAAIAYHAYGAPDDLWGTTWTASELASPAFGAAISAAYPFVSGADIATVDHIRVTLLYGALATQAVGNASVATSVANSDDWYSPESATVADGETALVRVVFGTPSSFLAASGFGFAVPATASIEGISLDVVRAARDPGTVSDHAIRLIKQGVIGSVDRSRPGGWDPAYTTVHYGGPTDRWGETWTAADINDASFGAAIQAEGNNDAGVDALQLTVHFCE